MKALVRTPEGPRYGIIMSRHRTEEAAKAAYPLLLLRLTRLVDKDGRLLVPWSEPGTLTRVVGIVYKTYTMRRPTKAGGNGKVGDRIPIDLSL